MNSVVNSWSQRAFGTSANGRSGAVNEHQGRMSGFSESGRGGAVNQYLQTGQSLMQGRGGGGYSVGNPFVLPPGVSIGPVTPVQMAQPPSFPFGRQQQPQRGPFIEDENPYSPDSEPARRRIQGYSQSQGANTTRSGPLSPRTSYKPTSMLPLSQRYSR